PLDDQQVEVTPLDSDEPILLQPEEWTNAKYQIDPATGEISETIEGRFIQYPLKTAWAITIHKSQGLTFERAVIDAADSFSHGQVYVALSRCKTIDGIILRTPLSPHCMIADSTVAQFNDYAATHQPDERELARQRRDYYLSLLFDLFDFHAIERSLKLMRRTSETYFGALYPHLTAQWRNGCEQFTLAIETIAQRFIAQLQRLATQTADPATDPSFNERIAKGRDYFAAQCRQVIEPLLLSSDVALDNQVAQQELRKRLQSALRELHIKLSTLEAAQEGFTPQRHLQARALATLDPDMGHAKETAGRKTSRNTPSHKEVKIETSADLTHPALAERLRNWRQEEATTRSLPNYVILSQKALIGISNLLPSSAAELRQIKGVGAKFLEQYGTAVLQIVGAFRAEHGIDLSFEHLVETQAAPSPPQKSATKPTASHRDATTPKPKIDTRQITLDLLNEGFTPEEAAHQRGLSPSTLYGHIADLIRRGTVEVERFMPEAKIQRLTAYLREHPEERFARMQEDLGNDYTYAEICWVKAARSAAATASDSTATSKES
ncbi:MAG: helix-turn-helix domain-containing protein, partial [Alistipes sp.]|nr:helix-turn-helix domain-containing protein [Alistipes sp.]